MGAQMRNGELIDHGQTLISHSPKLGELNIHGHWFIGTITESPGECQVTYLLAVDLHPWWSGSAVSLLIKRPCFSQSS